MVRPSASNSVPDLGAQDRLVTAVARLARSKAGPHLRRDRGWELAGIKPLADERDGSGREWHA
jgi:hypothetical protein